MTYGLHSAASEAALRGLFDRLRDHVGEAERRAEAAFGELEGALAADPAAAPALLAEPRAAAADVARLAADLAGLAPDLDVLRRVAGELADRSARLDARLVEAQAAVDRALAGLADRLDRWDAAAAEHDRRLAAAVVGRLAVTEHRRARRPAPPPTLSVPPRRGVRSAALLLSAGVACLGLTTLAVVLEPPFPTDAPPEPTGVHAEIRLRGPILIAPPRFAEADEFAPPAPPGASSAPETQRAVAAAIAAAEQGQPGAVARLRALADAGAPRAQMYLAKLYETGKGVAADSAEARRWTARAADAGDVVAVHNLALYYLEGRGGPRDDAMAASLFKRSARAGITDSQFNLGLLYESGAGVDRNLVEAYRWFQIAANTGDLKARERAVALEARLSPKEMAGAERIAASFRAGGPDAEETALIPGAATVAESQKKLARLGFYIGPTDGQDTPAYRQAVDAYRKSQRTQSAAVASAGQP